MAVHAAGHVSNPVTMVGRGGLFELAAFRSQGWVRCLSSAVGSAIDQYQVSTDKRSGITNDPNRLDDPEYIVRLIGQVITVILETVKIGKNLPPLDTEQYGKGA
jgi:hypothetical protein